MLKNWSYGNSSFLLLLTVEVLCVRKNINVPLDTVIEMINLREEAYINFFDAHIKDTHPFLRIKLEIQTLQVGGYM